MKTQLQNGDFCEVTREESIELLSLETGRFTRPDWYANDFYDGRFKKVYIRQDEIGLILSGVLFSVHKTEFIFQDFKQRLINTSNK